ncbi:NAD(P)/FAD-dependent oxidoreductase [Gordonia sp. Z-3]|uniref:NAD(P)/FAD-dependent oxidoreductase n=1 Tax=Gordonia aquimaris TaxID=2984863 RepID=A0A9X3I466_9ACTN|nr:MULTISPECIES: NAD(P)/FAD-dependent oxidoreductase [Gordonia]MAU81431.1 pyridine nucleotide-disulfide oxidoreductase [Gordonia sp. (in: high G+C Gram-positive bacteria)]MCX2963149.1 NAD(P)/FAD-dependent oxidoreductase [Gordonia aquimaris]MED5803030.1 NAD(P)/FAD-dependent oxidoreductase [Gordonia sp. Z-3]
MTDALVIGSGPSGLATGAELVKRGIDVTVLERGERTASAWAGRYDGLRFNTSRWWSALPGAPFPRAYGWFPTRDQYVRYLDDYAAARHVPVRHSVAVERIDSAPEGGWKVTATGKTFHTRHVVVATGVFNVPWLPDWARGDRTPPKVLHASDYHNAAPYRGLRVLVVGAGSTGMEIARELADVAAQVSLSVRTAPNILLRSSGGLPGDLAVPLILRLPTDLADSFLATVQHATIGDLSPYGLSSPPAGVIAQLRERGAGTAVVDKEVIDAIRDGGIRIVAAVDGLDEQGAQLVDGSHVGADVVIAATGYTTGLREMAGHLDVLDARGLPRVVDGGEVMTGLRFVGYVLRPGLTGYTGKLARVAARGIAASRDDTAAVAS